MLFARSAALAYLCIPYKLPVHLKKPKILLITPPLTQINTPYPATAYIKGFLCGKGFDVVQADLGIELILRLFSRKGLQEVFRTP
jgi:hypothetical protein